ncbi:S8 family serine peptidase [Amycolatopsis sp. H20-H5]|uniref:S8 family serine peptidase n=1 Tax=Amycolatopsis sp. H20-H5 TaxID=3046309 RepID=UPI002DBE2619|nr:S8 family serine peptidase [Amycolatopsis sp. H20-H5]MEC3981301.1 S8 family serine peptidase [Amycolatopsis sp. H20-H5]
MRASSRPVRALVIAACSGLVLSGGTHAAQAQPAAAGQATQAVIVVLGDQLAGAPPTKADSGNRRNQATKSQDAVLARMGGAAPAHLKHFALGNAFSATVTAAQAAALAMDPAVASVSPDSKVTLPAPVAPAAPAGPKTPTGPGQPGGGAGTICPADPAKPLLEPEALTSTRAASTDGSASAADLATGAGVKVAFLADNMDPNYPDFIRPDGSHVFADYQDFSGDGPNTLDSGAEAFGDASSIAAQGTVVHDLSKFVNENHPLPAGCTIVVKGVAPGASLVGLNVFGATATDSAILQAIDYAVTTDHVDVINESLGLNQYPDASSRAAFQTFNDAAVAAGVTVTTSSGDAGITSPIGSPATDPLVISTGATTNNRLYAQTTYAAFPFSNGKWVNDNISALSSSGITQNGRTIDLVAPGEGNWADCSPAYAECRNFHTAPQPADLESFGGTSESAPLTAGVAALVIQAYRGTHKGASPAPALVKQLITGTAKDLGLPADEQGSGLLDARAAVEAALTAPGGSGAPAGLASNISLSADQVTLEGAPGSTQSAKVNVTNVGSKPLTVSAGTRAFAPLSAQTQKTAFDSASLPTFPYYNGSKWAYKKVTFSVPAGAERLFARMAWQGSPKTVNGASVTPVVRLTLLAPDGTFIANSRPQGGPATANYANVDVRKPAAGTWTAVLYSVSGPAGYTGDIQLGTDTQRAVPYGQVGPQVLNLAPGQSKPVTVSLQTPSSGGDADYSVTFGSSDGHQTSMSAIVRSLIPTGSGPGAFGGTITGGNARAQSPAQTFSYEFDVPKAKNDLDVAVNLPDAGDLVDGVLIDPNGELADVNSNASFSPPDKLVRGKGLQLFDAKPLPGRWHLVVVVQNPVTGKDLSRAFTGTVAFDQLKVGATGLPNSASAKLPAGKPVTVPVTVTNTGVEPIAVGVDARTNATQTLQPVPLQGQTTVDLPEQGSLAPVYLIPPDTGKFSIATSSTVPAQAELQGSAAGIEVFGDLKKAQSGDTVSVATIGEKKGYVSKGVWFGAVQELGPFGPAGAPAGSASYTSSMQTAGFDHAVTSSTGDPFAAAVDPSDTGGTPTVIQPGQTATIQVTITPSGARNSVATGHLNLVTIPNLPTGATGLPALGTGAVIAQLPYSYRIG